MKNETTSENKGVLFAPIVVCAGAFLLYLLAQLIGGVVAALVTPRELNETYQLFIAVACNVLALFGLVSFTVKRLHFSVRHIGLTLPRAKDVLMVLPAFVAYFIFSALVTSLVAVFFKSFNSDQVQNVGFENLQGFGLLTAGFISLVILTPIFEEIIFRGYLFKGLRVRLPFWVSAVITSIIFAAAHWQWNVSLDVFGLSLVLCFLTEKSKSLGPAMALHALKNSLAFILLFVHK